MTNEKRYIRIMDGRFHSDPPALRCGVLKSVSKKRIYEWCWANNDPLFDLIEFGKLALKRHDLVKPCLHCFPMCKPQP